MAGTPSSSFVRRFRDHVRRVAHHARHGVDRHTLVFAVDDEGRPDQVVDRKLVLGNQPAHPVARAVAPHTDRRIPPLVFR